MTNPREVAWALPLHTKAYICVDVFNETKPVLYVTRADGDWCFLCGDGHPEDADYLFVIGIGHAFENDPTLIEVADLQPEEEADREYVGGPWVRSIVAPEG